MINVDKRTIVTQLQRISRRPFDFWLLNLQNDYRNLLKFLKRVSVPKGAELFTSELVYPGTELGRILATESVYAENETKNTEFERMLSIQFAEHLQNTVNGLQQGIDPILAEIIALAKERSLTLWLGAPWLESSEKVQRLYNAYILIEDGQVRFVHRKKYLWDGVDSEAGIYDVLRTERRSPISTDTFDGIFQNRAILICYEADKFFCPKFWKLPTRIPEVRKAKPDFVFIPSYWLTGNEHILRRLALSISRRIKDPIDKWMAVRTAGSLTLVINYDRAYVCGPVDEKKIKARVYAEQPNLGWLRIRPKGIEIGGF